MHKGFFITGTDTDSGKTWVALGLLHLLKTSGYSTTVMKPVSAGCINTPEGLRNEDAQLLLKHAESKPDYNEVNPFAFEAAIAPHIAAQKCNTKIDIKTIKQKFDLIRTQADYIVVEGAGGWQVPINENQSMADLAKILNLPVILVAGMKLGCLNHTILTVNDIVQHEVPIAGWIANSIEANFTAREDNIEYLKNSLGIPFLGSIPYMAAFSAETVANHITGLARINH